MRITSKGQVTIPRDVRERFGLMPNTEVRFVITDDGALLVKDDAENRRGWALVEQMRGRATRKLSTDEIMALTRGE